METIQTRAGTTIAYDQSGSGPALVLVHGSLNDKSTWQFVRPALEERFTVYAVNRRGREGSDAMTRHSLEDEFEDVAAVVNAIGEPVHLLGHSFGALCALGATLRTDNVRSLILYEPPPPGPVADDGMHTELRELMESGSTDDVVVTFLKKGPAMPDEQVAGLRQSPMWPTLVPFTQSLVEEIDAMARYKFDPAQFAHLNMPILLLFGDQSPLKLREVMDALLSVLPEARFVELPDQGHIAQLTAPDLLAKEIKLFLESVES